MDCIPVSVTVQLQWTDCCRSFTEYDIGLEILCLDDAGVLAIHDQQKSATGLGFCGHAALDCPIASLKRSSGEVGRTHWPGLSPRHRDPIHNLLQHGLGTLALTLPQHPRAGDAVGEDGEHHLLHVVGDHVFAPLDEGVALDRA